MCKDCVKILVDKKDNRSWDEQKQDWSLTGELEKYVYLVFDKHFNTVVKFDSIPDEITNCICGVLIHDNFKVYNDKRGICAILGSVCICRYRKSEIIDNGAFSGNLIIENQMTDLHKYHCDVCNKTMNKDNEYKHNNSNLHKKNYKIKNYRLCKSCKTYSIEKTKPKYFYACSNCYKARQEFVTELSLTHQD